MEKLAEKDQEIKQCIEYLLQAKKKLKTNPEDTDADAEVEHYDAKLAKLEAEKERLVKVAEGKLGGEMSDKWYQLADFTGKPYQDALAKTVSLSPNSIVDHFLDAVKIKDQNKLASFDSDKLRVYKNKDAFENRDLKGEEKKTHSDMDDVLKDCGTSKKDIIYVVVPQVNKTSSLPIVPSFDPKTYKTDFPFFEVNPSDDHVELLQRDDILRQINELTRNRLKKDKYMPIVISTTRGMGKTFFMKKFGLQQVKPELFNPLVSDALKCGRILSFDFAKLPDAIQDNSDVYSFFPRLMIYFLCHMFKNSEVDGIHFEEVEFYNLKSHVGLQAKFNKWISDSLQLGTERMMKEYIRLTNIAFQTQIDSPPVFLLDEIQILRTNTDIIVSKWSSKNQPIFHTRLSFLLTQLSTKLKPVCISTGTNDGQLQVVTEMAAIMPQILGITPLTNESFTLWKQLTVFDGAGTDISRKDEELVRTLIYSSCHIPRLVVIVHEVWNELRNSNVENQEGRCTYYQEMAGVFQSISKLYD